MANEAQRGRRRTVPVTSRTNAQQRRPVRGAARPPIRRERLGVIQVAFLGLALIMAVVILYVPTRNYFQQRAAIAELTVSIEKNKAKKEALLEDIEKYTSDSYVREQARRRLGAIEPGETPWRIVDPARAAADSAREGDGTAEHAVNGPWWEVLWSAITSNDSAAYVPGTAPETEVVDDGMGRLPTVAPPVPEMPAADVPAPPAP